MAASAQGHQAIVETLLQHQADVNLQNVRAIEIWYIYCYMIKYDLICTYMYKVGISDSVYKTIFVVVFYLKMLLNVPYLG